MYDPNVQMAQPVMAQPQPMLMSVQVPQGMMGGMMIQVQTPAGLMQVQIPQGLYPGQTFQMQVPMPARQPQMMMQQQQMMQQPMQMMMPPPPPPQVVIQQQPQVIVQQPATTVIHTGGGYYGGGGGYYGGDGGLGVGLAGGLIGGMMLGPAMDGGDGDGAATVGDWAATAAAGTEPTLCRPGASNSVPFRGSLGTSNGSAWAFHNHRDSNGSEACVCRGPCAVEDVAHIPSANSDRAHVRGGV